MSKNKIDWLDSFIDTYCLPQFRVLPRDRQKAKHHILQAIKEKMPEKKPETGYFDSDLFYYDKGYSKAIEDVLETLGIEEEK